MSRYFGIKKQGKNIFLNDDDFYHIKTVMRMKKNDQIEVVYNKKLYLCLIADFKLNRVEIITEMEFEKDNLPAITLIIPLLKEAKMKLILEKATELGVTQIIPVLMTRSIIKLDNLGFMKKKTRWEKICQEASEQSKRITVPIISNLIALNDLKSWDGLKIICSTTKNIPSFKMGLKNKDKYDKISIVIGPEGGLTKTEEELLIDYGFQPFSLGNRILRVETVPIVVLGIINYEYME